MNLETRSSERSRRGRADCSEAEALEKTKCEGNQRALYSHEIFIL